MSALGSAGYEGARNGLLLDAPETFYRMTRTVGDMFGISSWQDWASQNIHEINTAREQDPFYKVSADVMNDPYAKSIYGAISSIAQTLAVGAPGALIGMATGGVGFIPMLMGHSLMTGGLYGLAEYDSYIEDGYNAAKQVDPNITWQQVQDKFHDNAVWSALAEGGLEFAGEYLGGKLISGAGKAVLGTMGEQSVRAYRSLPIKILKGMFAGQLTDMPSEVATTAIQTELRNSDMITTQTAAQAVQEQFGSILLAAALGGGGGAITEHMAESGKRNEEIARYQQKSQQAQEDLNKEIDALSKEKIFAALKNGDQETILKAIQQKFNKEIADGEDYESFIKHFIGEQKSFFPTNTNPESKEFNKWLDKSIEDVGLRTEVDMGKKGGKAGKQLKTVREVYDVFKEHYAKYHEAKNKGESYEPEHNRWRIGRVTEAQAKVIAAITGFDAKDYSFTMDTNYLSHVCKNHPEITPEAFTSIVDVLANFTEVEGNMKSRHGDDLIATIAYRDGRRHKSIEVYNGGKYKQLILKTYYSREMTQYEQINNNPPSSNDSGEPGGSMQTDKGSLDHTSETNPPSTNNNTTASVEINKISERFARYIQGDVTDLTPEQITQFDTYKKRLESELKRAAKYGVIDEMDVARYSDMFESIDLPRKATTEEHEKWLDDQLDVVSGRKKPSLDATDKLNSSLLVPEMDDIVFRNDRMKIMAKKLQQLKEKDKHTTERLLKLGAKAIANHTANPQMFRQFSNIYANHDIAIMAAGMLHEQMNRETNDAILNAQKTGREEDGAYARLLMKASNEMTELFSGMGTSAGRALRAVRTIKEKRGKELTDALKEVVGGDANKDTSKMITQIMTNLVQVAQPKDKSKTSKVAELKKEVEMILEKTSDKGLSSEDMTKIQDLIENTNYNELTATVKLKSRYSRVRNAVIEATIAGMLTGPATHIVNTISGGLSIASEIHDRLFSGMIYKGQNFAGGFGETMAMLHAVPQGFADALRTATIAFKTGQSRWGDVSEKAGAEVHGVSAENSYAFFKGSSTDMTMEEIEADATGGVAKIAKLVSQSFGLVGSANRLLSTNTMLMSDEFMKTMIYHMQRRALAHRAMQVAKRQGKDGQVAYNSIMDGEIAPPEIHEQLMQYARYLTFQDPINQDSAGGKFWKGVDNARKALPESMLVVPFLKTPLNIGKWIGTRTPVIANLFSEYREAMGNNGDMAKKQLTEARMLTGSLLWNIALVMASEGILTGSGPTDKKEKEKLYATGWRPNSLHIGDTYYELTRLDPVATFLNTMATFVEVASDLEDADLTEVAAATLGSALKVASDKYYLSGITDFLNMTNQFDRYGAPYLSRLASNIVPFSGLRRTGARGLDPVMREARDFVELVKKDTPIASQAAAAKRTLLGEVVRYDGGGMFRAISPVRTSQDNHDPVYDELLRLQQGDVLSISYPQRRMNIDGQSHKLDTHQYSKYLELIGQNYRINGLNQKEALMHLFKSSNYQMQSDAAKGRLAEQLIRAYRYKAKDAFIESDPKLKQGRASRRSKLIALLQ